MFNPQYLKLELPAEIPDLNNIFFEKTQLRFMQVNHLLEVKQRYIVNTKKYPETQKENMQILDDYLTLCENHSVRPIMFLPPTTQILKNSAGKYRRDEFLYTVMHILKKHRHAVFLDGWSIAGFNNNDFYDRTHLNINGAAKFSAILNSVILQLEKS